MVSKYTAQRSLVKSRSAESPKRAKFSVGSQDAAVSLKGLAAQMVLSVKEFTITMTAKCAEEIQIK